MEWVIQRGLTWISISGALLAVGFEVYAASGLRFLGNLTGLLMTLWTILPYAILFAGRYFFDHARIQKQWLSFSLFEVCVVAWLYLQTLVFYPDAQNGLIFLFLPLLQSVVNLLAGIALYWQQHRMQRPH